MRLLAPKLEAFALLMLLGGNLVGCSEKRSPGDTIFAKEKEGFEKELTPDQRKAAIKQLQNETGSHRPRTLARWRLVPPSAVTCCPQHLLKPHRASPRVCGPARSYRAPTEADALLTH